MRKKMQYEGRRKKCQLTGANRKVTEKLLMGQGYKPAERPQERSAALEGSRQLRTW